MSVGVVLYGPPASGKDTVTQALERIDDRFGLFHRLKSGGGRTDGYRMTDSSTLRQLDATGDLLWCNQQYGSAYAIDRPGLAEHLSRGIPVVHLGQVEAIPTLEAMSPVVRWLVIGLWCPRDLTISRLHARGSVDVERRMEVWDMTPSLTPPRSTLNTGEIPPEAVAGLIASTVLGGVPSHA